MLVQAIYTFIVALFLKALLVPAFMRLAGRLSLTDRPGGRKIHNGVIPRTGGIAVFIGFVVAVLLAVPLREDLRAYLLGAGVLFVFGVLDDRFNLDYRIKLLGQTLAALVFTMGGGVLIEHFPFVPNETLPAWLSLPITLLTLVAVTNALNLSDGLDGLAAGIGVLSIGCLLLLAYQAGDAPAVTVSLAVIGSVLGFLRFNTFPARVFLGDAGSQFLGFSAGVLAVIVTQRSNPALSPVIPLLVLGLPILDMVNVMVTRIARGVSPFRGDRTHLHHRLLALGLNQTEAVSAVYVAQGAVVLLAYLLRYSYDMVLVTAYGAFCVAVLYGIGQVNKRRHQLRAREDHQSACLLYTSPSPRDLN